MCARHVGVDPRDDVAAKDVQTFPERLALPAVAAGLGQDLIVDEDRNALLFGDLARAVLRARVDDDELVDQRNPLNEAAKARAESAAAFPLADPLDAVQSRSARSSYARSPRRW